MGKKNSAQVTELPGSDPRTQFGYSLSPPEITDEDGFTSGSSASKEPRDRATLQSECWRKFHDNPQLNTNVRGTAGRLTGWGFKTTSWISEIQEAIEWIETDWRNRLYDLWPKLTARNEIEGELYLVLSLHKSDGFVEIDFLDPATLDTNGDDNTGIIFHSRKKLLPLFFNVKNQDHDPRRNTPEFEQIPSIYIARDPRLVKDARTHQDFKPKYQETSRTFGLSKIGGFYRFVVPWHKGLMTRRATAHLRTTIKWLNHYEQLKAYEIDHKKASGAYTWVFKAVDQATYNRWDRLSDDDKKKTAMGQPIKPGQRLVLPPGWTLEAHSPSLPNLSGQDTDILDMVSSGTNEPLDVMTGRASGTFATVRAQRGPMSDRTSDEAAYFKRYLQFDFWGSVFFLMAAAGKLQPTYPTRVPTGFRKEGDDKKLNTRIVQKEPHWFLEISFPVSESIDLEGRVRAVFGVKHGSLAENIGMPHKEMAERIGVGNYRRMRLERAMEEENYPDLPLTIDQEAVQETLEAEPSKDTLEERATDEQPESA